MNNVIEIIKHINLSFNKTDNYESKINKEILEMNGMSGKKTRHFYNNICSIKNVRYLEIGTWIGSSICSAMYNNDITCVAIDNWGQNPMPYMNDNPKNEFTKNFNKYKGTNNATFLENNCWDIDTTTIGKFNIYMYDGDHEDDSHYKALNHYLSAMDNIFIYIVDDWNWEKVRIPTLNSINDNKLNILYKKEIWETVNSNGFKNSDWHNGMAIFVLKQHNIYNENWFTSDNFDKYLSHLKTSDNQFLEIGSFEGLSTNYFIDNFLQSNSSKITCIDPWIKYSESTIAKIPDHDHLINESSYDMFINNIYNNLHKIIIKKGLALDIYPELKNNFYDFIYIDGDHSRKAVWIDACNCFNKVKVNGIIIFDDYNWNKGNEFSPKKAIDKFIKTYNNNIKILAINYQVIIKKIHN